jgi:hypothetical protein
LGRLAVLAAALAVALGGFAGAAQAAGKKGFIGTVFPFHDRCASSQHQGACLSSTDLRRMHQAHIKLVRWGLHWVDVQPTKGPYRWGPSDAVIGSLASKGIRVLPVVNGTPRWAAPRPVGARDVPPLETQEARTAWKRFLRQAVARYGPGGQYWTNPALYQLQFPEAPARPITTWQIWNEPNIASTFPPKPSPRKYARLVGVDPNATILLGGMPGYVHPRAWQFLDRLYEQRGIKRKFDAVAIHPYSPDVKHVMVQLKRMRHVMRRHHDAHSALWATELGWGSAHPDRYGINQGLRGQKRLLKKTFTRLQQNRNHWRLRHVFWYDWRDPPKGSDGCSFCTTSGLFRHSEKPKPSWRAFKQVTKP